MSRPKVNSAAQKELDKVEKQFEAFSEEIKNHSDSSISDLPVEVQEQQTKLSKKEIRKSNDIYLKPKRQIFPSPHPKTGKIEVFNEKHRKAYEEKKKYVKFVAENREIIGETITMWTKPFAGVAAEEWEIPVNKPVWAPLYVYENIRRCRYTRLVMEESPVTSEGGFTYYGKMTATNRIERLSAFRADDDIAM